MKKFGYIWENFKSIMKIKIILFTINIFFFSFISSAQSYKFDKFIIYQNLTDSIESNVYCNSNNSNYFLRVLNSYHGQEALIYDLINKKVHYFDVIKKSIGDDSNEISFKYKNSKAVIEKYNTNYFFEYNKIDDDSLYNYSKLVVYKNKSKNKKINEIELKIKKDKSNYFPLYRFCTMHTFEFKTEMDFSIDGIVETSRTKKDDLITNEIVLTNFEDFDLELVVPKDLIIK